MQPVLDGTAQGGESDAAAAIVDFDGRDTLFVAGGKPHAFVEDTDAVNEFMTTLHCPCCTNSGPSVLTGHVICSVCKVCRMCCLKHRPICGMKHNAPDTASAGKERIAAACKQYLSEFYVFQRVRMFGMSE